MTTSDAPAYKHRVRVPVASGRTWPRGASVVLVLGLVLSCRPPPKGFELKSFCALPGPAFGATVLEAPTIAFTDLLSNAVVSLDLERCEERSRSTTVTGPRAITRLGERLVVSTEGERGLSVSIDTGRFAFLGTTLTPHALAAIDLDGDQADELAVCLGDTPAEGRVALFRNSGAGLAALQDLPLTGAFALAPFDADGDGDLDLAVARTSEHLVTILSNTSGTLAASEDVAPCPEPFALTGSGGSLLITCREGGVVEWRKGQALRSIPFSGTLYETLRFDADHDGRDDLVSVDPFGHQLVTFWGIAGGFSEPDPIPVSKGPILLRRLNDDLFVLAFQDRRALWLGNRSTWK